VLQINSTDADEPSLFVPMKGAGAPPGAVAIAWGENLKGDAGLGTNTTEIRYPAPTFFYAEDDHQQYLSKIPNGYCGLGGTGVSCPIGAGIDAA
jgi:hypothetical protein